MADSKVEEVVVPCKKPHLEVLPEGGTLSVHDDLTDLSNFTIDQVLSNNASRKSITLKGKFAGSDGIGVVILEKTAFDEKKLQEQDYLGTCRLKQDFHNDIYANYECFPKSELNSVKTTIIHPATAKHVDQYGIHLRHIINETPEIYKEVIEPDLVDPSQFSIQWVYNILEHKSEQGKIVFEDSTPEKGFILLPDLKWDGKTLETLYLLAIPFLRGIKSLRDLTSEHLPLLKNIYSAGAKAIYEKYGVQESRLRIFLHYQPSFYHLHVHFTTIQYDSIGVFTEKSHLLANVISNISLVPDYYQRATLPFSVTEKNRMFKRLEEKGYLKKVNPVQVQDVSEESTN